MGGIKSLPFHFYFERIDPRKARTTPSGKRDYALLRLLWGNALRRNEVSQLSVRNFEPTSKTCGFWARDAARKLRRSIGVLPQCRREPIGWKEGEVARTIARFLQHLTPRTADTDASGDGICKMVVRHSEKAGIKKQMSPHRIRHSAITAALEATDGDVPKVQKLSRHRNLNSLMIYDDNRGRDQQDVTELLDGMF
jgi:integrase/recombinase XerC